MLNNFFRIFLPYGITLHPDNTITVFNREYLPIGFNKVGFKVPEDLPVGLNLKKIVSIDFWKEVAHDGELKDVGRGDLRLWFYNDATNPSSTNLQKDWDAYFRRIRMVQGIAHEQRIASPRFP